MRKFLNNNANFKYENISLNTETKKQAQTIILYKVTIFMTK